jgi:hypothetical protein
MKRSFDELCKYNEYKKSHQSESHLKYGDSYHKSNPNSSHLKSHTFVREIKPNFLDPDKKSLTTNPSEKYIQGSLRNNSSETPLPKFEKHQNDLNSLGSQSNLRNKFKDLNSNKNIVYSPRWSSKEYYKSSNPNWPLINGNPQEKIKLWLNKSIRNVFVSPDDSSSFEAPYQFTCPLTENSSKEHTRKSECSLENDQSSMSTNPCTKLTSKTLISHIPNLFLSLLINLEDAFSNIKILFGKSTNSMIKEQLSFFLSHIEVIGELNENFQCKNSTDGNFVEILFKGLKMHNEREVRFEILQRFLATYLVLNVNNCSPSFLRNGDSLKAKKDTSIFNLKVEPTAVGKYSNPPHDISKGILSENKQKTLRNFEKTTNKEVLLEYSNSKKSEILSTPPTKESKNIFGPNFQNSINCFNSEFSFKKLSNSNNNFSYDHDELLLGNSNPQVFKELIDGNSQNSRTLTNQKHQIDSYKSELPNETQFLMRESSFNRRNIGFFRRSPIEIANNNRSGLNEIQKSSRKSTKPIINHRKSELKALITKAIQIDEMYALQPIYHYNEKNNETFLKSINSKVESKNCFQSISFDEEMSENTEKTVSTRRS